MRREERGGKSIWIPAAAKQYDVTRAAWIGDYLGQQLHGAAPQFAGTQNDLGHNNPTFDGDLRKAQVTPDPGERMAVLRQRSRSSWATCR
jgi:ABC-type oligopeptide transport system substrate-binding subunit